MKTETIDNKRFYDRLWQLSAPIVFQSLMLASVAAGDALMLGRIAQEQMTAVSLATQIQFVQNIFIRSWAGRSCGVWALPRIPRSWAIWA